MFAEKEKIKMRKGWSLKRRGKKDHRKKTGSSKGTGTVISSQTRKRKLQIGRGREPTRNQKMAIATRKKGPYLRTYYKRGRGRIRRKTEKKEKESPIVSVGQAYSSDDAHLGE